MVRRTSKKNKEITLPDVKEPQDIVSLIQGVRNRYIEDLRRTQLRWMAESRDINNSHFYSIDHSPVEPHCNHPCLERQEVIEPLPDPDEQFFDPRNHTPEHTGECAICRMFLTKDYPEDYPEEWKFCCSCHAWAKAIIRDWDEDWLVKSLTSPTIKKIYEKLIVFGSEKG